MLRPLFAALDSPLGRVFRYLFSAAIIVFFITRIDWAQLARLRQDLGWGLIALATLAAGFTFPLHAWRWWLLYRAHGVTLSFDWSHRVTWIGQFYNSFLLSGVGGDAARVFYILRDAPDNKAGGMASIAVDRAIALVVLLGTAAGGLVLKLSALRQSAELQMILWTSLALLLASLSATLWLWQTDPRRWPAWIVTRIGPDRLGRVADEIDKLKAARGVFAPSILITLAIWWGDFAAIWLFARGIGLALPFAETCIAGCVAYAASVLPLSVGGHGIREGALIGTLALFGLVPSSGPVHDQGLLLGLLIWAATLFWSGFGGLFLLFGAPQAAAPARPSNEPAR